LIRKSDIMFEVALELVSDPARLADPDDPIGGPFYGNRDDIAEALSKPNALPELRPWLPVIDALVDEERMDSTDRGEPYQQSWAAKPDRTVSPPTPSPSSVVELMGPQPTQHGLVTSTSD